MFKITKETEEANEEYYSPLKEKKHKAEACFERLWYVDKEQFNPETNCMGRLRLARTLDLIHNYLSLEAKKAADLGSGFGIFSKHLRDKGATVDAVDIAKNALKHVENETNIFPKQQYIPYTQLGDDQYDLVLSTELIAFLPKDEYRLYFSELARLVKKDGFVVCSTPIDIYSIDAMQRFASLAETEFDIEKWVFSYHCLWIKLYQFLLTPTKFLKASQDQGYKKYQLDSRKGFNRVWFNWNSSFNASFFWKPIKWLIQPIVSLVQTNKKFLLSLESLSRFLWQDQAISHAIFIGKRRPLHLPPPDDELPIERKTRKIVWE